MSEATEFVVVSGKGGVGKTTVSASLAFFSSTQRLEAVIADADVDTPSLHLVLGFRPEKSEEARLSRKARVDAEKCVRCGTCVRTCPYGALEQGPDGLPEPIWYLCEGCGACRVVCPSGAIDIVPARTGELVEGTTRYGQPMVSAQLEVGEHNSGLLVSQVRLRAKAVAAERGADLLLVDGAPGIGCPVVSSLVGADAALVVAEPTPESLRGALRVLQVARHFGLKTYSVLNKYDLSPFWREAARKLAEAGAPVLAFVPYDKAVVDALAQGRPVPELYPNSRAAEALAELAKALKGLLKEGRQ